MEPRDRSPAGDERAGGGGAGGGGAEPGGTADEALRRLEQRLDRASDAAERLLAEAAGSAARAARAAAGAAGVGDPGGGGAGAAANPVANETPPAGWQVPRDSEQRSRGDLELLAQFVQSLRDLIPPELQRRLTEALRELLLAIRAVIDWYLERADRVRAAPAEVQDIPIT